MSTRSTAQLAALLGLLTLANGAHAQRIVRASLGDGGLEGDGDCDACALSADGGLIAFGSAATNVVAGDTNGVADVFVRDRLTGAVERVSVASDGSEANGPSLHPSISADGRYVAFESSATNLVVGDTRGRVDVFIRDRAGQTTSRVSVGRIAEANGDSKYPHVSADGQRVAFVSGASNLVAGDTNAVPDIYVRDVATATTIRVSVDSSGAQANGVSSVPSLSSDGNVAAFHSAATNLVANDTNHVQDAFVHDLTTGVTTRVSVASDGTQGTRDSLGAQIALSADGNIVAFESLSPNFVQNDSNGNSDIFVHDVASGTTELASIASDGTHGDFGSHVPALSDDGTRVIFVSATTLFDPRKTTALDDAFIHDRTAGTTMLVSMGCSQAEPDAAVALPAISADGVTVGFTTAATNLAVADGNGVADVYTNDLSFVPNAASRSNYGAGWPGTLGIPALTADADPALGTTFNLEVVNSRTFYAVGFQLIGLASQNQSTSLGGTLLVDFVMIVPQILEPGTTVFPVAVPTDDSLCNLSVFLQELILDPGASKGYAFSPGLELDLGI